MNIKAVLAAVAALAVLGIAAFTQSGGDPAPSAAAPAPAAPLGHATLTDPGIGAQPSSEPSSESSSEPATPSRTAERRKEAAKVAGDAIRAYTQWSYRDAKPTSWMDRLDAIATPGLRNSLREMFAHDYAATAYWRGEVVPTQRETRTDVESVDVSGMHHNTGRQITFTVTYRTAFRVKGADWSDPPESMSQFVTVTRTGSRWLVDNIVSTEDRS